MSISSVSGFLSGMANLGGAGSTRQNSSLEPSSARSDLDAIRDKGLSEWAREQKMEALKAKIRAEVLADKKITEDGLSSMSASQRTSVEDEIAKMIQQKMEEAIQQTLDDAAKTGKTQAVMLDIMV